MSHTVGSSTSQLSHCCLAWLPATLGGFALCFAFGLGCSSSGDGGGTGGLPAGSGGKGSGGTTASGGSTTATGGVGSGGTGGSATGGSATGGKPGSGGTSSPGGSTGSGGHVSTGGETGVAGSGGSASIDGGAGRGGGVAGSTGSGGTAPGGSTGSGGSTGTGDGKSAGCGKTSTITDYNKGNPIPISVGGQNRRYILQVPTNYDSSKPYKFILALHARDSNDKTMFDWKYYGLLPLSNNTVIFAAPNGVLNGQPCSGTGVGESGCGWPSGNIPLMDAVVKQVTDNFCVDMNHIYATGWSYGASMSYEIGCQRPLGGPTATATWGVRAVAIYSGAQMSGNCKPNASYPVAFYESHGTNDNVLGYDGGVNLAKNFATANGCSAFSPAKASGAHVCTNATGCKTGYSTEFCSFVGGHTPFPDSGSASNSWGPAEVWKFFDQF